MSMVLKGVAASAVAKKNYEYRGRACVEEGGTYGFATLDHVNCLVMQHRRTVLCE